MRRPRAQQLDKHKRNSRWSAATLCVCLVVLTWVVFGQTRRHEFVNYDDQEYVYQNKRITSGVSLENFCWAFTHAHSGNWHPLTTISHMLDCQFYGLKPAGHHLSNVVLHSVAVVLPFLVLFRLTGKLGRSAFVAALFAIHPLHVESVAWIAERKDVLSGVFFMLTLAAYTYYVRPPSVWRYSAVVSCYALGLMSKPMLVTLPLVLLLLDYWPLSRIRGGRSEFRHQLVKLAVEDSTDRALRRFQCRDICRSAGCSGLGRTAADVGAHQQRDRDLRNLLVADVLASEASRLLSTSGKPVKWLGDHSSASCSTFHYRNSGHSSETAPLSNHGVALVFGYAGTGNWVGASGMAGASRSIHLPPANWSLHHGSLERF